jgi:hypothetical protein
MIILGISNRSIKRVNSALKNKEEKVQKESSEPILKGANQDSSFSILRKNDKKKELPEFLL